ncbi:GNAT family N-acetyltransferase [Nocardioides sp. LHG3406-4]|uniref:GNAT family N-acetyltransferase n=1 Tax=Nocardioides sp. LHG3406-4 TaxID=2804575 RepID=UPI003CF8D5C8
MIRRATPDDLALLLGLERELFAADAWSEALLASTLTSAHERVWVAGEGAAYVVTRVVGELADLMRIGVAPAERRRGLARELLGVAIDQAEAAGAERMLLEVSAANTAAVELYAAVGFARIDVRARYYADGADALVLSRELG